MARFRVDYDGAWHHVMNRGARREPIFTCASDGRAFLDIIGEQADRTGIEVHAYCLMGNHYHLLVRTPAARLSDFMQHVGSTYTRRFNHRRGYDGPLFRGRFLSKVVDSDAYLSVVSRYIHRNPLDVRPAVSLDTYRWSSYGAYVGMAVRPVWLTTDVLWQVHGSSVAAFREHVDGPPLDVPGAVMRAVLSMALAEQHPDPSVDTVRIERVVATALADRLDPQSSDDLLAALRYPNPRAEQRGRERARRRVEGSPFLGDAITRTLDLIA
jgi:REP element-mobilizing transposase RayT